MSAVRMLARCEIRRRWRTTCALALLLGAVGAIVLASAAGARRSDSALARFNAYSRSADVEISIGTPTAAQLRTFRRAPGVGTVAVAHGFALVVGGDEGTAVAAPVDAALGTAVDRSRVIRGRKGNPRAPNEATVGEGLAARLHLRVGSHLDAVSYTGAQIVAAFHGADPGRPAGPRVRLDIVGIVRLPLDLGVRAQSGGIVMLTPAFTAKYHDRIGRYTDSVRVRAVRGAADVPRVVAAARRLWGRAQTFQVQPLGIESEGARSAIDVLTSALWIFAAVAALAGAVALGIVITRDISHVTVDQVTLRGLGVTRGQRLAATGVRAAAIALAGALLAGAGAIAASPFLPLGIARRADPDVGLHADWFVLGPGVVAIAAVVAALAFLAAWRATRVASPDRIARSRRPSSAVETAARIGLPPTATNGLRMALQAGSSEGAVPVRSAFAGAVLGIAGITAVSVFAMSLAHLVATPRLSGWTWDVQTEVADHLGSKCVDPDAHGLSRAPGVAAVAAACIRDVEVDGHPISAWGFESLRGTIEPAVVAGRAPRRATEVALGAVTLRAVHKHIGDTVMVHGAEATREYVVVGRIVLPSVGTQSLQPLADGAAFTVAGFRPIVDEGANQTHFVLIKATAGADRGALERRARAVPRSQNAGVPTTPVEITRLRQIDWFPAILAVLLATLALVAVGHALVTSVRRRRREIALLKTIGFGRRQVGATISWQSTTIAAVGLSAGIPAGLVLGRAVWRAVATGLGVSTAITVPAVGIAATIAGAVALCNLISFLPARAAARRRPAVDLRSE